MKRYFYIAIFGIVMGLIVLICTSCAHIPTDYYINLEPNDRIIVPSITDPSRNVIIQFITEEEFIKMQLDPDIGLIDVGVIEEEYIRIEEKYIDQWNRWGVEE